MQIRAVLAIQRPKSKGQGLTSLGMSVHCQVAINLSLNIFESFKRFIATRSTGVTERLND